MKSSSPELAQVTVPNLKPKPFTAFQISLSVLPDLSSFLLQYVHSNRCHLYLAQLTKSSVFWCFDQAKWDPKSLKAPFWGSNWKTEKKRHTDSKTPSLRRQGFTSRSYKMTPLRTKWAHHWAEPHCVRVTMWIKGEKSSQIACIK